MIVLIGLGNPGKQYDSTRHNAGKRLARYLKEHPVDGLQAVESEVFMNTSGEFVWKIVQNTQKTPRTRMSDYQMIRISDKRTNRQDRPMIQSSDRRIVRSSGSLSIPSFPNLIIAHDDLDIPFGKFKIQFGRGPWLHKGILSVEEVLGTKEFWRVRIGIDQRSKIKDQKEEGEEYVLSKFSKEELRRLEDVFTSARATLVQLFEPNSPFPKIVGQ